MVQVEQIVLLVGIVTACVLVPERVAHLAIRAVVKTTTAYYHVAGHGSAHDAPTAAVRKLYKAGAYKGSPMTAEGMREHMKFEALLPLDINAHSERVDAQGTPAMWVGYTPSGSYSNATELEEAAREGNWIIWLHGGGYTVGTITLYAGLVAPLARSAGAQLLIVDYPLLPEAGSFEAIQKSALNGWRYLTETRKVDPRRIIVAGDSAGGNLALQLSLELKGRGEAMPAGLLLDSPWVEHDASGKPFSEHEFLLSPESLALFREVTQPWATELSVGRLPSERFAGLPHVRIVAGGADEFHGAIEAFQGKLLSAGVNSTMDSYPKMTHDFMTILSDFIPLGQEAASKSVGWMKDTWSLSRTS